MAKKKRTALPRVTLLAYSRRDLLAFVESVEALRLLVDDLRAVARDLSNATVNALKKKPSKKPSPATAAAVAAADCPPGARFLAGAPVPEEPARE
jgi:hypothetical protein